MDFFHIPNLLKSARVTPNNSQGNSGVNTPSGDRVVQEMNAAHLNAALSAAGFLNDYEPSTARERDYTRLAHMPRGSRLGFRGEQH